ncbi:hypothetical protein [Thalassotalea fusca]
MQSKQLLDLARGAELAIVMAYVSTSISDETSVEQFDAIWKSSKAFSKSVPESMLTSILADAERMPDQDKLIEKLSESMKVCSDNLKNRQDYIDLWRELSKSCILSLPN